MSEEDELKEEGKKLLEGIGFKKEVAKEVMKEINSIEEFEEFLRDSDLEPADEIADELKRKIMRG